MFGKKDSTCTAPINGLYFYAKAQSYKTQRRKKSGFASSSFLREILHALKTLNAINEDDGSRCHKKMTYK